VKQFAVPPRNLILVGDALKRLRELPDESVDSIVTSPPYLRLRDYGVRGQLGMEATVEEWVGNLRTVLREIHRVLVPTGVAFLNLGDTYSTHPREGAPRKSFLLGPERLALWLMADGWTVRNKVVWHKPNAMPTSVRDRLSATWEPIYLLSKQPAYFFDLHAIRRPHRSKPPLRHRTPERGVEAWRGPNADTASGLDKIKAAGRVGHPLGANPGDVWIIPPTGYRSARGEHHATFPVALAKRMIRASTPEARCRRCRAPWQRPLVAAADGSVTRGELVPLCTCGASSEPGLVLDPFIGSGTSALAAEALGRDWLGIELNPTFAALADARIADGRVHKDADRREAA